jgi:hypothetical protein
LGLANMTDSTMEERAIGAQRDRQGRQILCRQSIQGRDSNRRQDGPAPRGTFPKRICTVQPGVNKASLALEGTYKMFLRSGRSERRTRLAVTVQISSLREPAAKERTITENACSRGLRILVDRQMIATPAFSAREEAGAEGLALCEKGWLERVRG